MTDIRTAALIAATLTTGLSAGLFFVFAYVVMPALGRSDDKAYVQVMQHVNVVILNGWFALTVVGALVFTVLAGVLLLRAGGEVRSAVLPWVATALAFYLVTVVVTIVVHVPLNIDLDAAGPVDEIADIAAVRERFEGRWERWNVVRAAADVAAFGALAWALLQYGRVTNKG
ncbi:DUF1772 domain-containing protein [Streptomyces sp. NPDC056296]|uniref:anthrone oxygenase family protein n=1 Tax=Streptomyces sp. NPDC056296 TaxID=3345775 RepID=UPI0035D9C2CA